MLKYIYNMQSPAKLNQKKEKKHWCAEKHSPHTKASLSLEHTVLWTVISIISQSAVVKTLCTVLRDFPAAAFAAGMESSTCDFNLKNIFKHQLETLQP